MKILFESNQSYQTEAIEAVIDLFAGAESDSMEAHQQGEEVIAGEIFSDVIYGNSFSISRKILLSNLERIQSRTRKGLNQGDTPVVPVEMRSVVAHDEWPSDFSVEMETGTGKTYIYLRTAIELYLKYGLSKFVVVVPSIAIKEGVLSSLNLMKNHFKELYSGLQYDSSVYDSKNIYNLRRFATSNHLQILIMNIASFNKDDNIIRRETDGLNGLAPIDFIRKVQPVVILDEPQKLGSDLSSRAINDINPLFRLRYSATHKDLHHLIYRLTPIDAYEMKLVKRIDVLSITADDNRNIPYIEVKGISATKNSISATLIVNKGTSKVQVTVRRNTDLAEETKSDLYQGWVIEDIHLGTEGSFARVEFSNGQVLRKGSNTGVDLELWQRAQIRATIEDHFETEMKLQNHAAIGVISPTKPLTLFFVDRVANYAPENGKFRTWFEEEYEGVASLSKFRNLAMPSAQKAHKGYFATAKQVAKDSKEGKGNKEDEEAFDLIMRDKERLLSLEEPVRFIFSHSALAEGWDNPNVFTICNLQEVHSEVRRRQQIGRGLRLPVMANGERCRIDDVNHLTIIATETFEKFAAGLQKEMHDETGLEFRELVKNKRDRVLLIPKDNFETLPGFRELWKKIAPRTQYRLDFSTEILVKESIRRLKSFERISDLKLFISKQNVSEISVDGGVAGGIILTKPARAIGLKVIFPDILKELANNVPVSRSTIHRVIMESGRLEEAKNNPAEFVSQVRSALFGALAATLKDHDGIKYSKRENGPDSAWRMEFFKSHFAESYEDNLIKVTKSIYDRIPVDSIIEQKFAEGLETREDVDLFLKLPSWFKIDTPVGGYNPDWAIVRRDEHNNSKLYLVRETKGTTNLDELFRESEVWKVVFGGKHFNAIRVDYKMVKDSNDLDKDEVPKIVPSVWEEALGQPE